MLLLVQYLSLYFIRFQSQFTTFRSGLSMTNLPVVAFQVANYFAEISRLGSLSYPEIVETVNPISTGAVIYFLQELIKVGESVIIKDVL